MTANGLSSQQLATITKKPETNPSAVLTAKKGKKATHCNGIIFPRGGPPYVAEVVVDQDGTIDHEGMTWMVAPGSIGLDKKGTRWIVLPESSSESLTGHLMEGKHYLDAHRLLGYKKDKTLEQLWSLQNQKAWYKQGGTWLGVGAIGLVALVLVWGVVAIGGGLEGITEVLQGLQMPSADGSNGASPGSAGHNTLQPR